ncbi:MAG: methyltransferase domain-containing protein [Thermodesulfobacteriota bacterium]
MSKGRMTGRMKRWYDERMYRESGRQYYEYSDFFNYGYWDATTVDQKSASENLMARLLDRLPERRGPILDVACGKGASTAYLQRSYPAEAITAINISEKQLETAKTRAPGSTFLLMDGANLEFADNSFATVLCVEAVFHFNSREKFLREALRVLQPGGHLLLTDILLTDWGRRNDLWWIEKSNRELADPEAYDELLTRTGFTDIRIEDATRPCWEGHYRNLAAFTQEQLLAGTLEVAAYEEIAARIFRIIPFIGHYLLVAARKEG